MINFFIKLTTLFVTLPCLSCNLPRIKDTRDADDSMITNASILDSQVNSLFDSLQSGYGFYGRLL